MGGGVYAATPLAAAIGFWFDEVIIEWLGLAVAGCRQPMDQWICVLLLQPSASSPRTADCGKGLSPPTGVPRTGSQRRTPWSMRVDRQDGTRLYLMRQCDDINTSQPWLHAFWPSNVSTFWPVSISTSWSRVRLISYRKPGVITFLFLFGWITIGIRVGGHTGVDRWPWEWWLSLQRMPLMVSGNRDMAGLWSPLPQFTR